ncbi:MAG TPA: iron ABC transporter permease, partial [Candidatus Kapabacteria bacterium]|nr:iron ABC transporter permease [Candidatus Kapabacteria bacterium]
MNKKYIIITVIGFALLLLLPFIGVIQIDFRTLLEENPGSFIFWQLRMPRTILAFMVGSTLALAGLIFQNIFRNSLATPYTLGVSSGAAAAVVIAIKMKLAIAFLGLNGIYAFGFAGALVTIFIILGIAKMVKSFSIYTLLMSGVALNFFFSSLILLVQYLLEFTETVSVLRWLMGGLTISGYNEVIFLFPLYLFFVVVTYMIKNELVLISGGDQFAHSKGMNVKAFRIFIFIMVSFLVGVV